MTKMTKELRLKMGERRKPRNKSDRSNDTRSPWDLDLSRVIHSAAYRRLQGKTQVLGLGEADFYRTRLTHSMEVSQICWGIVQKLRQKFPLYKRILPEYTLVTAIGMSHDMGHPPFGHGGEVALNFCMKNHGGFEGNAQTLRILSKLEKYQPEGYGINPTRRLLLGVLKYPISYSNAVNNAVYDNISVSQTSWYFKATSQKPPKCYFDEDKDVVDFVFDAFCQGDQARLREVESTKDKHQKPLYKSLDTSIMELADDISYSVHDLEDAIALKLITKDRWKDYFNKWKNKDSKNEKALQAIENQWRYSFDDLTNKLFGISYDRKDAIGTLIFTLIENITIQENNVFEHPLLKLNAILDDHVELFKKALLGLVFNDVIKSTNVQQLEFKGQKIIIELFEALSCDPERLLPTSTKLLWEQASQSEKPRIICDYIAGMTDDYAVRQYEKLLVPNRGSIFEFL